ncbi:Trm112 family protein [Candidatus Uabimicrobium sp. HlEnr_7]|uniref:Trm112 family protein n=1 Tax=Candidatus Uabimicrobium helgolandensis TaxID=3095367 RepID=UPI0035570CF9
MIDKTILNLLSCPQCHEDLYEDTTGLLCKKCKKIYPIEDEIIVLLPERALQQK